jgi:hypothetical protein
MTATTGPVEMLAVSFDAGVVFRGRIAEEIEKLETAGLIRVLDFLFLQKDPDTGALARVDYDGEGLVTRLIDGEAAVRTVSPVRTCARWPLLSSPAPPPPSWSSSTSGHAVCTTPSPRWAVRRSSRGS